MRAEDLKRINIFSFDEKTGFPLLELNRVCIIGQAGLARLRSDLIRSMGRECMTTVCFRYGYETGISLAIVIKENYPLDGSEEYLRACGMMLSMAGAANVEFREMHFDPDGRLIRCTGIWRNSIEAQLAKSEAEAESEPACAVLAGMMSGYASAMFCAEFLFRETACEGTDAEQCTFEGRLLGDWEMDVEMLRRTTVLNNLDEETSRLREALRDAQENMKRQASEIRDLKQRINVQGEPGIVCRSGSFARVLTLAAKVASSRATVLLQGESGTGKEVVARLIHRHSESAKEPFLAVNCAALPAQLLESELFGHKRGSFTGAESDKKGLFLQAGRGTLLLDEIGEMPLELQAKLLRALQQKEIRPVGGLHDLPVQARIIATANRDLKEMVGEGRFREDLFFRLSVFPITIPPLRERREDILPLAQNFLSRLKPEHPGFSAQAVRLMELYAWPGNVRELENWMEYAVILAGNERITPEHLPLKTDWKDRDLLLLLTSDMPTCEELEKRYIRHVLERTGHNKSEAARILGIGVTTLWRRQKGKRTD